MQEPHGKQHALAGNLKVGVGHLGGREAPLGIEAPLGASRSERPGTSPFSLRRISLVDVSQRRSQPSSCDEDVRSFLGQAGQVAALSSFSGGMGQRSSW